MITIQLAPTQVVIGYQPAGARSGWSCLLSAGTRPSLYLLPSGWYQLRLLLVTVQLVQLIVTILLVLANVVLGQHQLVPAQVDASLGWYWLPSSR